MLTPSIGCCCTPFTAADSTFPKADAPSQALNELQARADQKGTVAVVPPNDEMTLVGGQMSIAKTNVFRSLVDQPLLDVWFDNERSGFVVGAFNLIFHTDDGGASWHVQLDVVDGGPLAEAAVGFLQRDDVGIDLLDDAQRPHRHRVEHRPGQIGSRKTPGAISDG